MIEFMITAPLVLTAGFLIGMSVQFVYDAIYSDTPES